MSWQPIETAPKDGAAVLLYVPSGIDVRGVYDAPPDHRDRITVGWFGAPHGDYNPGNRWVSINVISETFSGSELTGSWEEHEFEAVQPTHWMPLPEPPHDPT